MSLTIPTLNDGMTWEVGKGENFNDTWHAISRVSFVFDGHPEPEVEPAPEPAPIPTDAKILSALGYVRLDLAKYAMIGGGLLVALIATVLWR